MNERKQRPGVMLYYDTLRPALLRLTDEQCGQLLRGIIEYAQTGALPDYDGMTGLAFDLLRPGIDRDGVAYEKKWLHTKYMSYCRIAKERGEKPIEEEEYIQQLMATDSNVQLPTSVSASTTAPVSSPEPISTIASMPTASSKQKGKTTGKGEPEGCKGDEGEDPFALFLQWQEAFRAGKNDIALSLANNLYKLGYDDDPQTMEFKERV